VVKTVWSYTYSHQFCHITSEWKTHRHAARKNSTTHRSLYCLKASRSQRPSSGFSSGAQHESLSFAHRRWYREEHRWHL